VPMKRFNTRPRAPPDHDDHQKPFQNAVLQRTRRRIADPILRFSPQVGRRFFSGNRWPKTTAPARPLFEEQYRASALLDPRSS